MSNKDHLAKARRLAAKNPKARGKSRVALGRDLLPTAPAGTHWARVMRTVFDNVLAHMGGADNITELQRLRARRIAFLESELIMIEDRVANARATGGEVNPAELQLYATLDNNQRRDSEALGYERTARDVTPLQLRGEILATSATIKKDEAEDAS